MNFISTFFAQADAELFEQSYGTYDMAQTTANSDAATAAAVGFLVIILVFSLIFAVISYVVYGVAFSRIFKKAGVEGWKAWVPVYNMWTILELGGQKGYWSVLAFVPIVNIAAVVFTFIAMYNIGLKLGKDGTFVLLAIFLMPVWALWLAFDKSTWNQSAEAGQTPPAAPTPPAPTATPPSSTPLA